METWLRGEPCLGCPTAGPPIFPSKLQEITSPCTLQPQAWPATSARARPRLGAHLCDPAPHSSQPASARGQGGTSLLGWGRGF